MAKALRLAMEDFNEKLPNMIGIRDYLTNELQKMKGVTLNTPEQNCAPHIVNFSVESFKAEVFVHEVEKHGLFVSTTSACSSKTNEPSKTILAMGFGEDRAFTSIRISLSYENTLDEAKKAVQIIAEAIETLKPVMRG